MHRLALLAAFAFAALACGSEEEVLGEGEAAASAKRLDHIGAPTETNVDLKLNVWATKELHPTEGWHVYHFTPARTGYYRIQMKAPVENVGSVWSYLRVEHDDPSGAKPWLHNTAGVGNTRTNLCELVMRLEEGAKYDIIATSQHNLHEPPNAKVHPSDGEYHVAVLDVDSTLTIPE